MDFKYDNVVIYANYRTLSSYLTWHLAEQHNLYRYDELFKEPSFSYKYKKFLEMKENCIFKLIGEQYFEFKKAFDNDNILENRSIVIIKPREILESYTSFILPWSLEQRGNYDPDLWNYKSKDVYDNIIISQTEALNGVTRCTQTVKHFLNYLDYFLNVSDDVHIMTYDNIIKMDGYKTDSKQFDNLDHKIELIEGWPEVEQEIYRQGSELWKKIDEKI